MRDSSIYFKVVMDTWSIVEFCFQNALLTVNIASCWKVKVRQCVDLVAVCPATSWEMTKTVIVSLHDNNTLRCRWLFKLAIRIIEDIFTNINYSLLIVDDINTYHPCSTEETFLQDFLVSPCFRVTRKSWRNVSRYLK